MPVDCSNDRLLLTQIAIKLKSVLHHNALCISCYWKRHNCVYPLESLGELEEAIIKGLQKDSDNENNYFSTRNSLFLLFKCKLFRSSTSCIYPADFIRLIVVFYLIFPLRFLRPDYLIKFFSK